MPGTKRGGFLESRRMGWVCTGNEAEGESWEETEVWMWLAGEERARSYRVWGRRVQHTVGPQRILLEWWTKCWMVHAVGWILLLILEKWVVFSGYSLPWSLQLLIRFGLVKRTLENDSEHHKKGNPIRLQNCRVETDFRALWHGQQCPPQPQTDSICKFEMPKQWPLVLTRRFPPGIPQSHQSF